MNGFFRARGAMKSHCPKSSGVGGNSKPFSGRSKQIVVFDQEAHERQNFGAAQNDRDPDPFDREPHAGHWRPLVGIVFVAFSFWRLSLGLADQRAGLCVRVGEVPVHHKRIIAGLLPTITEMECIGVWKGWGGLRLTGGIAAGVFMANLIVYSERRGHVSYPPAVGSRTVQSLILISFEERHYECR